MNNSRRKIKHSKSPKPSDNGLPGGGKGYIHSRSFPVPCRKRSPKNKQEAGFKAKTSRRKRSPRESKPNKSRKVKPVQSSRKKIVTICVTNGRRKTISYIRG